MVPMRARRMRLERAPHGDVEWMCSTLDDASRRLGTRIERDADGTLTVRTT